MGVGAAVVGCDVVASVGAGVESVDFAGALRRAITLGLTLGPKPVFLSILTGVAGYRQPATDFELEDVRCRCFGEHGRHKAVDDK